ncbi:S8 family peptidase [Desulfurococcaceae archaeon MEX13E-LK6-19]|nr:S8 family peptidase [Desulfurococcaceae archaeon MEX13E-LK6-19]
MSVNRIPILFLILALVLGTVCVVIVTNATGTENVRVIVTIDKKTFNPGVVEALGGKVVTKLDLIPVVIVDLPAPAIKALEKTPGVLRVERDGEVRAYAPPIDPPGRSRNTQPPETIPWGIDRIKAPLVWNITTGFVDINGDGDSEIEVAIIDTGVDYDHPDLYKNIKWGVSVVNGVIRTKEVFWSDKNGHGTHVTGTVAAIDNDIGVVGVAPDVEIYMIKALGNGGTGSWSDLILAIEVALKGPDGVLDSDGDGVIVGDPEDDAPEVISMSLGGSSPPDALHDIICVAYSYNVTIVAAAGNEGADTPSYPAAYPEVIAVGATDSNDLVPDWSNRNPEVAAPGVDILSTYPDDTYATLSGTSMATPHVSGTVALIQAARLAQGLPLLPPGTENDISTTTIRGILHTTADDVNNDGYDSLYGYGIIRADKAVEQALSTG